MNIRILIISTSISLSYQCDHTRDYLESFNAPPYFSDADGQPISNLSDSLKRSQSTFLLPIRILDANDNLKEVSLRQFSGNGALDQDKSDWHYTPENTGTHHFAVRATDHFSTSQDLSVILEVFDNLTPVAKLEISNPSSSVPFQRVMDAAGSYDRDMRFGGSIRQYEYSWLGRSLTHDKPRQTVVFPGIGIFPVGLRVRDTDRSWSKLFQTSVEIR